MKPVRRLDLPKPMRDGPTTQLFAALAAGGVGARFVGGCVRNAVSGRAIDDIDIAVTTRPEITMRALQAAKIKVIPTGLKHGTVTAIVEGRTFELTTLRRDVETDGRHAVVAFTDDWQEDASRRDFTFNALYADPDGTLYDPFGGEVDLARHKVRFIGDPDQRIVEDRLRVLRFFRFQAWYGAPPLDGQGFEACARHAGALGNLSGERVAKEVLRLLAAPGSAAGPADAVEAMSDAGALDHWLPEYEGTTRLRALMEREPTPDGLRRLAAILPEDADATAIGKRLKLSTQQAVRLTEMLVRDHKIDLAGGARAWRAGIYRLGQKVFTDLVLLSVDAKGDWRAALAFAERWTQPDLPVSGADILKLGLAPGPKIGALITAVEEWWIAGDFTADREACLAELGKRAQAT
jgi:poly(A) polymerase